MRLIELRLKNLNSLKGEWHIDFADSAFINEGIFAITGHTGAGKTTILDAVCLALYGETPRIGSISKSSNEVMTRQTAECFAEVVIDLNGIQYRCRWGQRRAYNKADGNLQDATHEIAQLNHDDPAKGDDVLESKLTRAQAKIVELTRMDFQQFTRSILLAQGSFSAFLKAKADERADILEKITGTDIYATISEHVHEKKRFEEDILSKLQYGLQGLTLLNSDEENELKTRLESQQNTQNKQQQLVDHLSAQIKWLESIIELTDKRTTYQSEVEQARQVQQEFSFDAKRLGAANKALEIDSQYSQLVTSRDTANRLKSEQQALADQLPTQQATLNQAATRLDLADEQEKTASNELENTLPKIAQARKLDGDITQHTQTLADHTQRKQTLDAHTKKLRQEIEQHNNTAEQSTIKLVEMDESLAHASELNDLDTSIANFDSTCGRLKTLLQDNESLNLERLDYQNQLKQARDNVATLKHQHATDKAVNAKAHEQITMLKQQREALIESQSLASLRGEQEHSAHISAQLDHIAFKIQKLVDTKTQSDTIAKTLPTINDELIALAKAIADSESALKEAKDKRQDKQNQLYLRQKVAALEDYIADLKDNHPCPLCGALEHPYGEHHPHLDQNEASHSKPLQEQMRDLDAVIDNDEQVLSQLRIQQATNATSLEQYTQQLTPLQEQSDILLKDIKGLIDYVFEAAHSDAMTTIIQPLSHLLTDKGIESAPIMLNQLSPIKAQLIKHKNKIRATLTQHEEITDILAGLNKSMEAFELRQKNLASDISESDTTIKIVSSQIESINHKISSNFEELQTISETLLSLVNTYPAGKYAVITPHSINLSARKLQPLFESIYKQTVLDDSTCDQHIEALRRQRNSLKTLKADFNTFKDTRQTIATTLSRLKAQIETQQVQLNADKDALSSLTVLVEDKTDAVAELKRDRQEIFADKDCNDEEQRLRTIVEERRIQQIAAQRQVDSAEQVLIQLQLQLQQLDTQLVSTMTTLDTQAHIFERALAASSFKDEAHFSAARLSIAERNQLSQRQQHIEYNFKQAQTLLAQTEQTLGDKQINPLTTDNIETLTQQQQQATDENKHLIETIGAISQQLKDNESKKQNQQAQLEVINVQKENLQVWQQLYKLIGSSDGKKYRTFAQGLTFDIMVNHANTQLHKMSDRYLLIRDDNSPLELNVIDNYQGGEIRSTKNLSGGEGFIISLALALGLSQMASQNIRVDSLFLDEGFGTLDDESLDIALDTLTSLQQEGKLIGVISHVQALKERILTQIQVQKLSGGFSQITGQGCYRISS
ncbi:AAA family ATPase [Psychrobacter sp. DM4]|uniref:AAA family ATPase n=1 Tax=Psychrobacter sp. DM4 TaxID=3440637 RepID=UPI003F5056FC